MDQDFYWIFIATGVFVVPVFLVALTGRPTALALYGLETHDGLSITGLIIFALFIFKGITAFGLWTENHWAIKCGIADAIAGIIICSGFCQHLRSITRRYLVFDSNYYC